MLIREIAVPETAGILRADGVAVFVEHVGNDENFRMSRQAAFLAHMLFENAETLCESDLLCRCDALIAEKRHFVVEKRVGDVRERVFVQRLRKVYAGNFRAEVFAEALDLQLGAGRGKHDGPFAVYAGTRIVPSQAVTLT